MPSGSYEVIFVGHLLLGVFTSIGISLVYLRYFGHGIPYLFDIQKWIDRNVFPELSDDVLEDSNSTTAFGMFLFFPLSFGPQVLSAGRTFALVMVIVAPFPILVLRSMRLKRIGSKPAIALMVTFLLVTSGFVSATATHDVSPTNYRRGADRRKRIDTGAVRILSRISIAKQYRRDELRVRTPSGQSVS